MLEQFRFFEKLWERDVIDSDVIVKFIYIVYFVVDYFLLCFDFFFF